MGQEKGPYAEENITNTVEKKTTQTIKFILLFKRLKKREREICICLGNLNILHESQTQPYDPLTCILFFLFAFSIYLVAYCF